ncbi:MAG: alpha/beta fold hydrolase [Actinomycetota bacterium]|nr:alpha/beta fold hydrolase [Actinomycetota bacterium]
MLAPVRFSRGGLTFDVRDSGPRDGPPVVCLHGFPQDATAFDGVSAVLVAAGCRVVAPDQRGYSPGARPTGRRDFVLSELAGDVVALLDFLGLERAHVVGHDWGGAVAWRLASAHAARVSAVTVLATAHPAAMVSALSRSTQALRSAYVGLFQLPVLPERLLLGGGGAPLRALLVGSGLPRDRADHYVSRMLEPGALSAALAWYRAVPLAGRDGTAGRARVPVTYVRGGREPAITARAAELTAGYVRAPYRHVEWPDAGHWLPETRAREVAELILEAVAQRPDSFPG